MPTTDAQTMTYERLVARIREEILPLFEAATRGEYARYRNPQLRLCWDAIDDDPSRCLHATEHPEGAEYLGDLTLVDQLSGDAVRPVESCRRCVVFEDVCPTVVEELGEAFNTLLAVLGNKDTTIESAASLTRELASSLQDMDLENRLIREKMITDPLTGLFNRARLNEVLLGEVERCHNRRRNLSLLMIDIDDFKVFNDTRGHLQGDKVLARLGRLMLNCVRDTDQAFRYGGEEFLVVMPDTVDDDARIVAERIRDRFAALVFDGPASPGGPVIRSLTLSGGIGTYVNGMGAVELLEAADQALYAAKHRGKDRIEIYASVGNVRVPTV